MWQTSFFEKAKSPPTLAKHRALEGAFRDWLSRQAAGGVVFDGFAGAGRFGASPEGGIETLGSPLLLLRWAQGHSGQLRFVFAEKNAVNFSRLCAALGWFFGEPPAARYATEHATIEVHATSFEECAGALLPAEASLFSFVDPYGADGVSFATLDRLAGSGDLALHLATGAIRKKLVSASGASPKQARRMDALLGGETAWTDLRRQARTMDPRAAESLIAGVLVRGLSRHHPGLSIRLLPLRDGEAHLIFTAAARHQ